MNDGTDPQEPTSDFGLRFTKDLSREMRAATAPTSRGAVRSRRCQVTVLMNFATESPPV